MKEITNSFSCNITTLEELSKLYEFIQGVLGEDIISLSQFQDMWSANPEISYIIKRKEAGEICGFLSFSYLTAAAFKGLKQGTLKTLDLNHLHQTPRGRKAAALYIGAIGASKDKEARRATMYYLDQIVSDYKNRFNCSILIKPITEDGLKITLKRDFQPLNDKEGIGFLYVQQ